jgi:glycerol-3-phosphate dehydrogenase
MPRRRMARRMQRDTSALAGETFDLLIIGGGIVGAGVARDAALRGLRTALVEQGDFASGTSSRSSKLIHGGFRYLEQHAFHLVAESCRERAILLRIAPHLVRPVPFLLPVYDDSPRSLLTMRLGMTLYDLLALYRNTAPHRTLGAEETLAVEPNLRAQGLRGAIRYYDCAEDDARFCVDNILQAADLGVVCNNYCKAIAMGRGGDRIASVRLRDQLTGRELETRARMIVNAAGPWTQGVAGLIGADASNAVRLSPTKGVHLLLPAITREHAIAIQSPDRRILFIIPWHDCSIVGTTDTDFSGDPAHVAAEEVDIDYLLREIAVAVQRPIARSEVITTFAGVRPLLAATATNPSARSREHRIIRQAENLITIAGGKYTTYRKIAEEAVDEVYRLLGQSLPRCQTSHEPIPARSRDRIGELLCPHPEVFESDVLEACREEMATTVSDVMWRRTGLALSRCGGESAARRVAAMMASELKWDDATTNASLKDFLRSRQPVARVPPVLAMKN